MNSKKILSVIAVTYSLGSVAHADCNAPFRSRGCPGLRSLPL
jgi:hypothetical protein